MLLTSFRLADSLLSLHLSTLVPQPSIKKKLSEDKAKAMQSRCITLETYHLRDFVVSHAAKIISTRIQMSMQLFMYGQVFEKSKTWCLNQTFWKTKAVPTSCK